MDPTGDGDLYRDVERSSVGEDGAALFNNSEYVADLDTVHQLSDRHKITTAWYELLFESLEAEGILPKSRILAQMRGWAGRFLHIMDIGCGPGEFAEAMVRSLRKHSPGKQVHYLGIDPVARFTEKTSERLHAADIAAVVDVQTTGFRELDVPRERERFDLIFANHVIYFFDPGLDEFIDRLGRFLAPNGMTVVIGAGDAGRDFQNRLAAGGRQHVNCDNFETVIRVPEMTDGLWSELAEFPPRDPSRYSSENAATTRKILEFRAGRSLSDFPDAAALERFVTTMRGRIDGSQQGPPGTYGMTNHVSIVLHPNVPPQFRLRVEYAAKRVDRAMARRATYFGTTPAPTRGR